MPTEAWQEKRRAHGSHVQAFIKGKQLSDRTKQRQADDGETEPTEEPEAEEGEDTAENAAEGAASAEQAEIGDKQLRELRAEYLRIHDAPEYHHKIVSITHFYIPFLELFCFLWEFFICLVIILTCVLAIFHTVFSFADPLVEDITIFLSFVYGADVLLRLIIEILRGHFATIYLVFKVQYTFAQFIFDLLVLLPIVDLSHMICNLAIPDALDWVATVQIFYLFKLFSLYRLESYFSKLNEDNTFNNKFVHLFKLLFYYIICCELFSAWLFAECSGSYLEWLLLKGPFLVDDRNTSCYLTFRRRRALFLDKELMHQLPTAQDLFFLTMDFVVTILTTTGKFGTIPLTNWEFVIVILIIFASILINGHLASHMLDFCIEHDSASYELFHRLDFAENLYKTSCPHYFIHRINEYYLFFWNFRQGVKEKDLNALPGPMHESIMINICQEIFEKSLFFYDLESSFLTALAQKSELVIYNPGYILCSPVTRCSNMFFLLQGELIVRSKTNMQHISALLRPGCIIGEINLLFSIPYDHQIETKYVCQALVISSESLFQLLELFPHLVQVLREKFGRLTEKLSRDYEFIGTYPFQYAVRKEDRQSKNPRYTMRRKVFIHTRRDDVTDDSANTYIMTMPTYAGEHTRDYTRPYRSCPVPIIFFSETSWTRFYNIFVVVVILILGAVFPACAAFHQDLTTNELDLSICQSLADYYVIDYVIPVGIVVMVILEVIIASPSSGFWFCLKDGLFIRIHALGFYLDLGCAIALVIPQESYASYDISLRNPFLIVAIVVIIQFVKVWRYFILLANLHPLHLLFIRCLKTITTLVYGIHYTACFLYWMTTNIRISWIDSITIGFQTVDYLGTAIKMEGPYLYPVYFATSLLTSAGYTEFCAQTFNELIIISCLEVIGLFLLVLLLTELASSISCSVLPMLRFQQRFQGITQCLKHYDVNEILFDRIYEHYKLQFAFTKGVKLPSDEHVLLYDAPHHLFQNIVDIEYRIYLQGIPLFTSADDSVFLNVVNNMGRYVLPPGITFQRAGEIRHEMYVIVNGYVGLYPPPVKKKPSSTSSGRRSRRSSIGRRPRMSSTYAAPEEKYETILGPTAHFGIRDLLFSEPARFDVKTLSYVHLFVIDQPCLKDSLSKEEASAIHSIIQDEKAHVRRADPEAMERRNAIGDDEESTDIPVVTPSWMEFPKSEGESFPHCTYEENKAIWETVRCKCLFKLLLMSKTVHPCGTFAKAWTVFSSLGVLGIILTLFIELFMGYRTPFVRFINLVLDIISWMDIYLKLHWAYYTKNKSLISHPAMTSARYVKEGMFLYDAIFSTPAELVSSLMMLFFYGGGFTAFFGYGLHASWYSKLRWIRFLQIYRFLALFGLVRNSSTRRLTNFIAFYAILTVSVSIIFATIAIEIGCPLGQHDWRDGDEYRLPYCFNGWIKALVPDLTFYSIFTRLVIGLYYSIQVLFCVGFGDLTPLHAQDELIFVLIMTLFGVLLLVYVASDITAAEVDSDELRADFVEHKSRVLHLLRYVDENRGEKWIKPVSDYLNYTWLMSRGLQPKQLFGDLHPSLSHDLFKHFVGDSLDGIPLFQDLSEPAMRFMFNLFEKVVFLKGSHLARIGNLQFEFCILIRGSAYVCNSSVQWLCTIRAGEFFGETDLLFELPRKHAIVAATNVEVLVLSLRNFNKLVRYYPKVRGKMLEMLKDSLNDIHESKIRPEEEEDPEYTKTAKETTRLLRSLIRRNPRSLEGIAQRVKKEGKTHRCGRPLYGSGIHDSDLPVLYMATDRPKKFKFLIHPKCPVQRVFEKICLLASFFYPGLALYWVIFIVLGPQPIIGTDVTVRFWVIASIIICQIIFVMDMILHWITPFELYEPETYCKVWTKIMINYFTDLNLFVLDVLTVIPWYLIHPALVTLLYFRMIYLYRHLSKGQKDDVEMSIFASRLKFYGSLFLLFGHVVACLFFHLAFITPEAPRHKTWIIIYREMFIEPGDEVSDYTFSWYLRSLYFAFVVVTTTGLGEDIVPHVLNTYLLTVIAMFVGTLGVSVVIANIAVGLTSLSQERRVYFYNVLLMTNHLKSIGLSWTLEAYVRAYYLTMWHQCRGVPIHETLQFLPKSMRLDVSSVLFCKTIQRCQMFGTIGELTFIRNVACLFKHSMFLPGQFVACEGEPGNKLFIIHSGEVAAYERNDKGGTDFLKKYKHGDAFGKAAAFFYGSNYAKSYRAETFTQILVLSQAKILLIAKYYPRWQFYVEHFMHGRHQHILNDPDFRHIFNEAPPKD